MPNVRRLLISLPLLAIAACGEEGPTGIRSYDVPKEEAPAPMMTPTPAATAAAREGPLRWELPAGWETAENPNTMRFATLVAGEGEQRIEVAVSSLAGEAGGVAANVNRWRGQIGLPAVEGAELEALLQRVDARGTTGLLVDLVGPAPHEGVEQVRMLAAMFPGAGETWFIKTTATNSALAAQLDAFMELCRSVSFGSGGGAAPPAPASAPPAVTPPAPTGIGPTWGALPDGWTADANAAAMSVASFTIAGDGQEAQLTITPLGGGQDLLANVNRWRRQVGLGPVADLAEADVREIEVDGAPAHLVDVQGDQHTVAVVAVRGGTTWFYKLSGPDPLVSDERAAFESFVQSVEFP